MSTIHRTQDFTIIRENDDVIIALRDYKKGEVIERNSSSTITLTEDIPKGHKIAARQILAGENVLKYGYSIGVAKEQILPGCWIHTHNLATGLSGLLEYEYDKTEPEALPAPPAHLLTFDGYLRPNGEAGIRNEIWIINTVGCINKVCEALARMGEGEFKGRVDGVYHFPHPFGCSQLGDDLKYTQQLLASLVVHPNAGGVLVIGLGCENNQVDDFKTFIPAEYHHKVRFLKAQETDDELSEGMRLIEELVEQAEHVRREPLPLYKLKIGLKCGGSDGFSGITANPLVGVVSDLLVAAGGTAILTEVPEMFGAETILMNRAANQGVYDELVKLINGFKQYFVNHGQNIYENPSPGNKAGGITTLEEKSLGCTQKGGRSEVVDILSYGNRTTKPGLNIVEAPGNDLVSVTALSAAGAHIVLFTTGRGTPFGGPVPTVKIATNSDLARRKKHWIDYNAGQLLEGISMEDAAVQLLSQLVDIASGRAETNSEQHGFREIAIFKDGVIL
ncbi:MULTISPECIES: UxaA family hydrolase [unclassified Paenibacillus]|uniref:UxaA family hydrolase n=1 Tax=unclassified Paenibacillus TaxID=185978 RepID=UPI00089B9EE3|nr:MULTISPECIES: altronate dehydratase family protein [unclassified Paenibacillus]OMC71142.1 altronate hydrolase [Paenibacillus sp. FSL H7-0326]SDW17918.1 D-altronate dehydratase [Paenibacillus sp. PDC88]